MTVFEGIGAPASVAETVHVAWVGRVTFVQLTAITGVGRGVTVTVVDPLPVAVPPVTVTFALNGPTAA